MSKLLLAPPLRFIPVWLVAVLLAAALVACGSNDDESPPLSPSLTPTVEATAYAGPTAAPPSCEGAGIGDIPRDNERRFSAVPQTVIDASKTYVAEMQTTRGVITLELDPKFAPVTVNSFVFLSCHGYFDGLTFHRVVHQPTLNIIQGGDPRGDGTGGPGYVFANEISDLKHVEGAISMANAGADTNGSQFFICLQDEPALDGNYSVFGHVTEGLDVAKAIAQGDVILAISVHEAT